MGNQAMRGSTFRMFQVWETAPPLPSVTLMHLTVLLSFACATLMGSKCGLEPCLRSASFDCDHIAYVVRMWLFLAFSHLLFWMTSLCFCSLMNCQSAWDEAFNIASWPIANWVGVARAVVCTAEFMAFRHAARTHLKPRKESKSRLSLICALRIMLWSVLWHLSIMEFDCWLQLVKSSVWHHVRFWEFCWLLQQILFLCPWLFL